MFEQTEMAARARIVDNEFGFQELELGKQREEIEARKGNIFYASDGSDESVLLVDKLIFGNGDRGNIDAQITWGSLGVPEILSRKRQGFNVLLCDFNVLDSDSEATKAIKKFTKKLPGMPVFIFCSSHEQYRYACLAFGKFVKNIFLKSWSGLPDFILWEVQGFLRMRNKVSVAAAV